MIFPFFRPISTFCFLHGTLLFGLSVIKKGNSVSLSPIKCMYWFYVTIFSISSLYYDVGVKSFWPLWYRIALHCVLPQFSKTFVIRSFFYEKWLLTHVFGGSQGQKFSCKQACVELLTFWPWYHNILNPSRKLSGFIGIFNYRRHPHSQPERISGSGRVWMAWTLRACP